MGTQTIIHGRITLKGDIGKTQKLIAALRDDKYPRICTQMFSVGATEHYSYYEEPVVAFAATYKSVEDDWDCFILKFEHLLKRIEFDTARIQMETEFFGLYHFFWQSKTGHERFEEKDKMTERPLWYFGHGYRSRWGQLEEGNGDEQTLPFAFEYPVIAHEPLLKELRSLLQAMELGNLPKTIYVSEYLDTDLVKTGKIYLALIDLYLDKEADFGNDVHKGYWMKRMPHV